MPANLKKRSIDILFIWINGDNSGASWYYWLIIIGY